MFIRFLDRLERKTGRHKLFEAIKAGYRILTESATPVLYHFLNAKRLSNILLSNSFTPNPAEQEFNGAGNRYMSFTRTGSFYEGYGAAYTCGDGTGSGCDDWGMIRITVDGSMLNDHPNIHIEGDPKQYKMSVHPFDWVNHEYSKPGYDDDDSIPAQVKSGKEWMMLSDDSSPSLIQRPDNVFADSDAHPYAQAEDRLVTNATVIPHADRFITRIDIVLVKCFFTEDNLDERCNLYRLLMMPQWKHKVHVYMSNDDLIHNVECNPDRMTEPNSDGETDVRQFIER